MRNGPGWKWGSEYPRDIHTALAQYKSARDRFEATHHTWSEFLAKDDVVEKFRPGYHEAFDQWREAKQGLDRTWEALMVLCMPVDPRRLDRPSRRKGPLP